MTELLYQCCYDSMMHREKDYGLMWHASSFERWVGAHCGRAVDLIKFRLAETELKRELKFRKEDDLPSDVHAHQLKGGGNPMETEQKKLEMESADEVKPGYEGITLLPTKAGRGFKVIHDGQWFYARKDDVLDVVNRKQTACTFSQIKDE